VIFTRTAAAIVEGKMLLKNKIEQCQLHLERMKQAAQHIQHLYPFREDDFPLERYEDLTSLEMYREIFKASRYNGG
jgi:hypothetical protein